MVISIARRVAFCAALALAGLATAATGATLKIGTEGGYPPWSMVDANGKVTGFDADVGHAICKKLDMKCRFVVQAFDSLIPSLQAERFDLVISGLSVTAERAKAIAFSIPYATEDSAFVVPAGSPLVKAADQAALFKDLAGKTVGVQSGTTQGAFLQKHAPDLKLKTYETQDQMQIDLSAGRLDATFSEVTPQSQFLNTAGKGKFAMSDVVIKSNADPAILGQGIGAGINQKNTSLKQKVDKALCELITDGSIKASSEKWFGVDLSNYRACK
ncbi:MAG: transporter substrate-binding domain-containing protein [Castellaniella sp.]|uniref:transporter substrate-binding domain-containing protein n=1 Tax=Castellaniella sp. TaxID=1955812 RepID=UPI0011FCBEA6|nr:transporter substrate-binding domain-containing protein [Castellaniella sp.]TAN30430.1 MAG: transporter substrate-binding domain-containing protein [Castellaniella sp.]